MRSSRRIIGGHLAKRLKTCQLVINMIRSKSGRFQVPISRCSLAVKGTLA